MSDNAKAASRHARAIVVVESQEAMPFETSGGPDLVELRLQERFDGEMTGDSLVRALQVKGLGGTSTQVSMQRVRGSIGGRQGSYVLQGESLVSGGEIRASWFVVPGSGTADLSGLRGEGGFEGRFGQGSTAWLDYWFE